MSNLKTAKELKAIADSRSTSSVVIQNIITAALEAASEGAYSINYDRDGFQYHTLDATNKEVIEKLVELGYKCFHQLIEYQYGARSDLLVSWE